KITIGAQIDWTELFFLGNSRVYANVAATRLGGFGFNPPAIAAPCGGGAMVVESVFAGDANNQPITSFQAGDTVTLNMRINNTTGCVIPITRQYRATGPNGYTLLITAPFPNYKWTLDNLSAFPPGTTVDSL